MKKAVEKMQYYMRPSVQTLGIQQGKKGNPPQAELGMNRKWMQYPFKRPTGYLEYRNTFEYSRQMPLAMLKKQECDRNKRGAMPIFERSIIPHDMPVVTSMEGSHGKYMPINSISVPPKSNKEELYKLTTRNEGFPLKARQYQPEGWQQRVYKRNEYSYEDSSSYRGQEKQRMATFVSNRREPSQSSQLWYQEKNVFTNREYTNEIVDLLPGTKKLSSQEKVLAYLNHPQYNNGMQSYIQEAQRVVKESQADVVQSMLEVLGKSVLMLQRRMQKAIEKLSFVMREEIPNMDLNKLSWEQKIDALENSMAPYVELSLYNALYPLVENRIINLKRIQEKMQSLDTFSVKDAEAWIQPFTDGGNKNVLTLVKKIQDTILLATDPSQKRMREEAVYALRTSSHNHRTNEEQLIDYVNRQVEVASQVLQSFYI